MTVRYRRVKRRLVSHALSPRIVDTLGHCYPLAVSGCFPQLFRLFTTVRTVYPAVLSAIEHGQGSDTQLAARIASAAILASADVDAERSRLYLDLLLIALSKSAPRVLEVTMNSLGYEYQSNFARRYVAEGKAEGRIEGRIEILLQLLVLRFGPLTETVQAQIRNAQDAQLHALAEQVLTAQTLEEALASLS